LEELIDRSMKHLESKRKKIIEKPFLESEKTANIMDLICVEVRNAATALVGVLDLLKDDLIYNNIEHVDLIYISNKLLMETIDITTKLASIISGTRVITREMIDLTILANDLKKKMDELFVPLFGSDYSMEIKIVNDSRIGVDYEALFDLLSIICSNIVLCTKGKQIEVSIITSRCFHHQLKIRETSTGIIESESNSVYNSTLNLNSLNRDSLIKGSRLMHHIYLNELLKLSESEIETNNNHNHITEYIMYIPQ
jgi:hypothetical protein